MTHRISARPVRALLCASIFALCALTALPGAAWAACPENPGGTCRGHPTCSPPANGRCTDVLTREGYKCECQASKKTPPVIKPRSEPQGY